MALNQHTKVCGNVKATDEGSFNEEGGRTAREIDIKEEAWIINLYETL